MIQYLSPTKITRGTFQTVATTTFYNNTGMYATDNIVTVIRKRASKNGIVQISHSRRLWTQAGNDTFVACVINPRPLNVSPSHDKRMF